MENNKINISEVINETKDIGRIDFETLKNILQEEPDDKNQSEQ